MQEHIAKKLRLSILLWLMLLSLAFPYLVYYYEQHYAFQWEEMVQPHWEAMNVPAATVEPVVLEPVTPEIVNVESTAVIDVPERDVSVAEPLVEPKVNGKKKVTQKKIVSKKKNDSLALRLPEDLYQGEIAEWDEKPPVMIPNFFAPKKESASRVQLGGRLIIDEGPQKKQKEDEDSYLDSLQGAELNISIPVR